MAQLNSDLDVVATKKNAIKKSNKNMIQIGKGRINPSIGVKSKQLEVSNTKGHQRNRSFQEVSLNHYETKEAP